MSCDCGAHEFTPSFFLLVLVRVILVFTFLVPCCDVCPIFRVKTMFGSSGGNHKIFEVMTSTIGSVSSLLAATLYLGNSDRNHKLWNIGSTERYIFHATGEIKIKDTTVTARSASYIDLYLDSDSKGRLRLTLYHKRDNFNFPIVNFPFI
jgi:hypothetical protein